MAKKNENIIKFKTKSGIQITLDKRVKDDTRLLLILADVQDKSKTPNEQIALFKDLLDLFFGDGSRVFLNEVAAHHDGVADFKSLMAEMNDIFEALELKNS